MLEINLRNQPPTTLKANHIKMLHFKLYNKRTKADLSCPLQANLATCYARSEIQKAIFVFVVNLERFLRFCNQAYKEIRL